MLIGFAGGDQALDGVALDSSTERAVPDPYDDQDDGEQQCLRGERRARS
ncbi:MULTISPECIES: hypothetical protein [unclassified Streptomyces]